MWTRMRTQRNTSAKDYVAEAKARAETELGAYLGSGRRRGK